MTILIRGVRSRYKFITAPSIMLPNDQHERLHLRLAQFKVFNNYANAVGNKDAELAIQELDLSMKIPSTSFLQSCDYDDIIGDSILDLAFKESNVDLYNLLIHKGADFNIKDKDGKTVLHKAFHGLCLCRSHKKLDLDPSNKKYIIPILTAHVKNRNTNNSTDSDGLSHFHIACAMNDAEAVEFFLNNGVSVNQAVVYVSSKKLFEGYSPLHFAAEFGCKEVTEILLKHGASVHQENEKGQTALLVAIERNITMIDSVKKAYSPGDVNLNEQIIDLLVNHSACSKFLNLLVISTSQDSYKAENFFSQEIDVNQRMNSQVFPGYTALHFAAHVNVDTVKVLLKNGANIEAKGENGVTPFEICLDRYSIEDLLEIIHLVPSWKDIILTDGTTKLVELLLAFQNSESMISFLQKSKDNVKLSVPLDSALWPGFTVLHVGVMLTERRKCKTDYKYEKNKGVFNPDLSIITECLKQNADVTIKDHHNWTPVHLAFRLEKKKTLKLLLQHHHRTQNPADEKNLSHLHIACADENKDLVKKLLWNDADVNVAYQGDAPVSCVYPGWTPLHIAAYKRNCEIAELLVQFDANIYAADVHGFTPVHRLMYHSTECRKLGETVFKAPSLRDLVLEDTGLSYLHVACAVGDVAAVKRLLDLGADVNKAISRANVADVENYPAIFDCEDYDGSTPLHWALECNEPDRVQLVCLLIERGADLLARKANNEAPLHDILQYGYRPYVNVVIGALQRHEDLRRRLEMETGVTMLHVAVCIARVDLVKELLDDGADVNARIHEDCRVWSRCTPLHVLVNGERDLTGDDDDVNSVIEMLLRHNADVTLTNGKNDTPLYAIYRNLWLHEGVSEFDNVVLLLRSQKNFEVNPTSVEGISHLHIACHMLEVDVVENFLKHGVDVNSKVDAFCDSEVAAATPLHLAVKSTRDFDMHDQTNSFHQFARLRIVDLLIKNDADVNAEDVFANTPAHYAAACDCCSKESLFRRLVKSGADVNARNLRGQVPLEILLQQKNLTVEQVRCFIMLGCRFNAFNKVTEKGCIALADSVIVHEDMLQLLFETFINLPDSLKIDDEKRTALHNIVSIDASETTQAQFTELINVLAIYGCDIDDQDNLGRTALHLAAQFRNETAVAGLLLAGADINVTDQSGKTPFAYVFELCNRCSNGKNRGHDQYSHPGLFKTFTAQMKNMEFCNIYVSPSNGVLLDKALKKFGSDDLVENDVNGILKEVEQIANIKIEPYPLSAADFVSAAVAVIDYPMMPLAKRKAIDAFFRANRLTFQTKFKLAAGMLQFQYRQALLRRKIIGTAVASVRVLARCQLPDICSHIILRSLKNFELQNLIMSTVENDIKSKIDVDG